MLTHFIGAILSFIAIFLLVDRAKKMKDPYRTIGYALFGGSMLIMFSTSTIYHALRYSFLKRVFRMIDHITIYIYIVGCYMPFVMTVLRQSKGKLITIIEWSLATFGVFMKILFFDAFDKYSMLLYFLMGSVSFFSLKEFKQKLSFSAVFFLLLGGVMYSIGSYFYNSYTPYWHAIWHVAVLLGSFFHFICICYYL